MPNVAMKAGIPVKAIKPPLIAPHKLPTNNAAITGIIIGSSPISGKYLLEAVMLCPKEAAITADNPKIDPTERSIPFEMITNVIPRARIP